PLPRPQGRGDRANPHPVLSSPSIGGGARVPTKWVDGGQQQTTVSQASTRSIEKSLPRYYLPLAATAFLIVTAYLLPTNIRAYRAQMLKRQADALTQAGQVEAATE